MRTTQPVLVEKTIALGRNLFRIDFAGNWQVLMWGWWPDSGERPSYRWQSIEAERVPYEVKKLA